MRSFLLAGILALVVLPAMSAETLETDTFRLEISGVDISVSCCDGSILCAHNTDRKQSPACTTGYFVRTLLLEFVNGKCTAEAAATSAWRRPETSGPLWWPLGRREHADDRRAAEEVQAAGWIRLAASHDRCGTRRAQFEGIGGLLALSMAYLQEAVARRKEGRQGEL